MKDNKRVSFSEPPPAEVVGYERVIRSMAGALSQPEAQIIATMASKLDSNSYESHVLAYTVGKHFAPKNLRFKL